MQENKIIARNNMSNDFPLSFSGSEAVKYLKNNLFGYFKQARLNPYITEEWKKGIFELLNIKIVNLPDLNKNNYIMLSNHISDFDAIILGLIHANIRIVAKIGWAANSELMDFLGLHYNIVGIYRDFEIDNLEPGKKKAAEEHNMKTNLNSYRYLKDKSEARHLLIFPQGTISDINKNSRERINPSFARIADATKTSVINIFLEYPGTDGDTRIIYSEPYDITDRNLDYSQIWLDSLIALQNKLDNVRKPVLSEKHSLNNNPGEPFFV
jgi:hypothetical protein